MDGCARDGLLRRIRLLARDCLMRAHACRAHFLHTMPELGLIMLLLISAKLIIKLGAGVQLPGIVKGYLSCVRPRTKVGEPAAILLCRWQSAKEVPGPFGSPWLYAVL